MLGLEVHVKLVISSCWNKVVVRGKGEAELRSFSLPEPNLILIITTTSYIYIFLPNIILAPNNTQQHVPSWYHEPTLTRGKGSFASSLPPVKVGFMYQ